MAYVGREPRHGFLEGQTSTFNGSTTTVTLQRNVSSTDAIDVYIDNVHQEPDVAYTLSSGGDSITFTGTPENGAKLYVRFHGITFDTARANRLINTDGGSTATLADNDTFTMSLDGTTVISATSSGVTIPNLTVTGTTTSVNSTNLEIGDNKITLNSDVASNAAPSENAGITINRGSSADVDFIWNETTDEWYAADDLATGGIFRVKGTGSDPTYGSHNLGIFRNSGTGDAAKISIIGNSGTYSRINFGDENDDDVGQLNYSHTTDAFSLNKGLGVTGNINVSGGSASAPAYTFSNDTNTGMFRTAANTLGFSSGGTEYVQLGSFGVAADQFTNKTAGGDVTIDAAGSIILDADSGDINFKDNGVETLRYSNSASGPQFFSPVTNKDIIFKGKDDTATITALTLDMSEAGAATFNSDVNAAGIAVTGTVKLDGNYPTGSRNVAMGDDALGTISSGASNVALGHNASKTASSAQQTTAVGDQALYDNTASYNTAVGYRAAFNVSSGVNNTAIGTNSLYSSSTTNGNVAVGESSVYGNTGGFNIGVGNSTLRGAGAGEKNIAIGDSALRDNTSGSNQVAIGYQSLTDNLTGTRNTAVGHITLSLSQTTNDNTVMGYLAGRYTVGGSNTALGAYAMSAGSGSGNSAASNVAVGKEALEAVTTGSYNVALGAEAGERVTTATEGVYIGFQAANYTQGGIDNTAVGTQSLYDNVSGEKNVAVGKASLGDLGTGGASAGNRNTAVGSYAFRLLQDANDNTAVGYQAGYTTTAGARLALFGYKAGFSGTNSSFQDNAMFGFEAGESNDGNNNAFFGSRAGEATTSASSNTYIGTEAGQNSGSANGNTFIGRGSGKEITGQNNTVLGRYTGNQVGVLDIRTTSNNIVLSDGDGNPRLYANSTGNWTATSSTSTIAFYVSNGNGSYGNRNIQSGVNRTSTGGNYYHFAARDTAAGADKFVVHDDGSVYNGTGTYGTFSDEKLKENIQDASSQWDDIKALRVRKYSMKADALDAPNQIGVIAQELETSGMSGLVINTTDCDNDGNDLGTTTKQVKYSILYMKAVKALQEAMDRIETLEAKVTALENA